MKLDLFDVRNVLCEIPQKDKNAFDANLYVNFSEDKLFEKANKVAKIMPNFFKEMGVTRKPFQRTSDNTQQLLFHQMALISKKKTAKMKIRIARGWHKRPEWKCFCQKNGSPCSKASQNFELASKFTSRGRFFQF